MVFTADPVSIDKTVNSQRTQFQLTDSLHEKQVRDILSVFQLSGEKVVSFADVFREQMENGLRYDGSSPFTMQNTFVYSVLDGSERGKYLALDLGGSNFRVLLVEIANGKIIREEIGRYEMSQELRMGNGIALFDYLASCLSDFANKQGVSKENLPLGFTFSFPMEQSSLDSGTLTQWIGQYSAEGVEGHDVVKMLREAVARNGSLNMEIVAILNDTTGTLLRGSLIDSATAISLILGTGSNACYFEKTCNMAGWTGKEKEAVLNIEWGPLPDSGLVDFIDTKYDKEVDTNSMHPGIFRLEKYIGGKFFGELVRLVLCELAEKKLLFNGKREDILYKQDSFKAAHISEIEKDNIDKSSERTKLVLNELGIDNYSEDDIRIIKFICEELSIRTGLLAAACLAEITKRIDRPIITVAVDGSLYKYHPRLHDYITLFTNTLLGNQQTVKLILAEDGSGVGAAMVAAMACKSNNKTLSC